MRGLSVAAGVTMTVTIYAAVDHVAIEAPYSPETAFQCRRHCPSPEKRRGCCSLCQTGLSRVRSTRLRRDLIAAPRIMDYFSDKTVLYDSINYVDWRDDVLLQLGLLDLDYALRFDKPLRPDDASDDRDAKERYNMWERSNRSSLLLIIQRISRSIRAAVPKCDTAKGYLEALDKQFKLTVEQMGGAITSELCAVRLTSIDSVGQHIMEMRGTLSSCVTFESNFYSVNDDTWWIDTGSMIHISTTMQGFLSSRSPHPNEETVLSGSGRGDPVKAVGTFRIHLSNQNVLELYDVFYVPSYKRWFLCQSSFHLIII